MSESEPPRFEVTEAGTVRDVPLRPHEMGERITPADRVFTLAHFGLGRIAAADWSLSIEGQVERPLRLTLAELGPFPRVAIEAVHQCAGNPLQPDIPTRRVAAVVWGGVRLADVLDAARPAAGGKFVWADGADGGEFGGSACAFFRKDLPLERVGEDVLLATEMNGRALDDRHGAPVRLVVPGFYGTNSVKWLWRITLADRRANGPFTTRFYNDTLADGQLSPVWALGPESIIVTPAPGTRIAGATEIAGWAWADRPIVSVEIGDDGGEGWEEATIESRRARTWQRWRHVWRPRATGPLVLRCRARDSAGVAQPETGRRNAWHATELLVTSV